MHRCNLHPFLISISSVECHNILKYLQKLSSRRNSEKIFSVISALNNIIKMLAQLKAKIGG